MRIFREGSARHVQLRVALRRAGSACGKAAGQGAVQYQGDATLRGERRMTRSSGSHRATILALVVFALAAQPAWAPARQEPRGILRQYAPGLLVRTSYVAESSAAYRVEIWDLVVGPGKTSAAVKLPGGAVLEVRAGSGTVVIQGKRREFRPGAVFTI